MRLERWLPVMLAALVASSPARAQQDFPAPPIAEVVPLPAGEAIAPGGTPAGPPLEYFDYDAWRATFASPLTPQGDWAWQILPDGIIYRAYLANPKESRIGTTIFWETDEGQFWDSTLGGRAGILRYGTSDAAWPQGWQLDIEGSVQVRLDPEEDRDVRSSDYRFGVPLTYGYGRHRLKIGYYHHCSHLGDEFLEEHPTFSHLNFVRDAVTLGYAYFLTDNLRLYGEIGYGIYVDVSEEWELQFGFDYAPALPTGIRGAPFCAMNVHLREELNYSGNFVAQAGWAWRGPYSSHLIRAGLHYYNGLSDQYSFFRNFEQQIGIGFWYDF